MQHQKHCQAQKNYAGANKITQTTAHNVYSLSPKSLQ